MRPSFPLHDCILFLKVTDLLKLVGGEGLVVPDIVSSALAVMEAVQDMANIAQKIANDSVDEV